jgi:predicted DNA binding protein
MACIVRGTIPAVEFALYDALSSVSDVEFEIERVVASGEDAAMPLVWARGADDEVVERAIEDDSSTRNVSLLAEFEDEQLYRMEWISEVKVVLQMITNSNATITDAYGVGDSWELRVLYPTRDSVTKTTDYVAESGLTFDIGAIRELEGEPSGRFGLTDRQFEALRRAGEAGYFEIPRGIDQEDLADELGISHQALSERLRRGIDALVEDTILVGTAESRGEEG